MKTLEKGGLPDGTRVHDDLAAFARWLIDDAAQAATNRALISVPDYRPRSMTFLRSLLFSLYLLALTPPMRAFASSCFRS
jgi:hypothetical protein